MNHGSATLPPSLENECEDENPLQLTSLFAILSQMALLFSISEYKKVKVKKIRLLSGVIGIGILILLGTFIGCTGMDETPEDVAPGESSVREIVPLENTGNEVAISGFSLSFPAEWDIFPQGLEDNEDILLHFADPGSEILGTLRFLPFDFPYQIEKVVDYYDNWVGEQGPDVQRKTVEYGQREYQTLQYMNGDMQHKIVFLPYSDGVGIFEYGGLPEDRKALEPLALGVLRSVRRVGFFLEKRNYSGISFSCFNGSWKWIGDRERGFFLASDTGPGEPLIAGIWELGDEDPKGFPDTQSARGRIFINNTIHPCEIYRIEQKENQDEGGDDPSEELPGNYLVFAMDGKEYCFYSSRGGDEGFTMDNDDIEKAEELLAFYLSIK